MKKKIFLFLVLTILFTVGAFAQSESEMSVGFGGYFTNDLGGGVEASFLGSNTGHIKTPYQGGGVFIFADLYYFEMTLGFFGISGKWEDYGYGVGTEINNVISTGFDIGLYGKYPFSLSNQITLFPLLGITYHSIQSAEINGSKTDSPDDLSAWWFKFGGGLGYSLTENIYLRTDVLYGFRLRNKFERDLIAYLNYQSGGLASVDYIIGHGFDIKLAIGYRMN